MYIFLLFELFGDVYCDLIFCNWYLFNLLVWMVDFGFVFWCLYKILGVDYNMVIILGVK